MVSTFAGGTWKTRPRGKRSWPGSSATAADRLGQLATAQEEAERGRVPGAGGPRAGLEQPAGRESTRKSHQPLVTDPQLGPSVGDRPQPPSSEARQPTSEPPAGERSSTRAHAAAVNVSLHPRASALGSRPRMENRLPGQTPSSTP